MTADDPLEPLRRWLADEHTRAGIASQVTIRSKSTVMGQRTAVSIDHLLACELAGYQGWRITTKRTFLPAAHFSSLATHQLKTANHDRGRTIYCMDRGLDDEVVAAVSYHVDDRAAWPLFMRMIGLRIDVAGAAELRRHTLAGAYVTKQYVHAIAQAIGRPTDVHVDLYPRDAERYAAELGFRRARRLAGLRVAGLHMCQPPLVDA